jgi:F-type H+-transporting ATPase subunit epsilon
MAMQIDILTPEKSLYSGEVIAVQFPGVEGSFQILTDHAPLVAALGAGQIVIETANGSESIDIPGGVVEVSNNILSVLAQ